MDTTSITIIDADDRETTLHGYRVNDQLAVAAIDLPGRHRLGTRTPGALPRRRVRPDAGVA